MSLSSLCGIIFAVVIPDSTLRLTAILLSFITICDHILQLKPQFCLTGVVLHKGLKIQIPFYQETLTANAGMHIVSSALRESCFVYDSFGFHDHVLSLECTSLLSLCHHLTPSFTLPADSVQNHVLASDMATQCLISHD